MKERYLTVGAVVVSVAVVVLAGVLYVRQGSADSCGNLAGFKKGECWRTEITTTLQSRGIDAAFELLAKLYTENTSFSQYCHDLTHLIGDTAYHQFVANKTAELSPLASYCGYGFYHGFMEALLYTTGDLSQARDFCSYAQEKLGGDAKGACYHGIGHGFLDGTNREGWGDAERMVSEGLSLCERVGENQYFVNRCASGIFNSLAVLSDNPNEKDSIEIDRSNPYGICALQTKPYFRSPCYEEMNTLVYRIHDGDLVKGAAQISTITDVADAAIAMEAFMSYAVGFDIDTFDNATMASFCNGLENRLRIPCIKGVGTGLAEFGAPGQEYTKSIAFCQSSGLTAQEQEACLGRLMPYLAQMYSPAKMQTVCASILPEHREEFCQP